MSRLPILLLALVSLVVGAWSGLVRAGVPVGPPSPEAVAAHGALMVGAVLGTLISLERAVALGGRWALAAPVASGLAGLAAVVGAPWGWVTGGLVVGSAIFTLATLRIALRQLALFTLVLSAGAGAWLAGNVAWASGVVISRLVLFWIAFLVLTIVGERLELSRLRRPPKAAERVLAVTTLVFLVGCAWALVDARFGAGLAGAALVASAVWLFRHDVARRTVHERGLPGFIAVCLLAGYGWLLVGGLLLFRAHALVPGFDYDAALHSLLLGFVFSMIFGHAPVILPAVLGISIPASRALYAPLALLHTSVALRVVAALSGSTPLRSWAAVLNVFALASYPATVFVAAQLRRSASSPATSSPRNNGRGMHAS